MADKKISELTGATTPVNGAEVLPIVQSGSTVKVPVADLTAGRAVDTGPLTATHTSGPGVTVTRGTKSLELSGNYAGGDVFASITATAGMDIALLSGGAEIFRAVNTGNVNINNGNLVFSTSGKGIDFSADGQAAGMTSELLDDYEEGSWTPVPADAASGGNAGTASSAFGTYVKIGSMVYVTGVLTNINTTGLTAGNTFFVQGLPFSAFDIPATTAYYVAGGVISSAVTTASSVSSYITDNTSAVSFFDTSGSIIVSELTSAAADFYFSISYRTA